MLSCWMNLTITVNTDFAIRVIVIADFAIFGPTHKFVRLVKRDVKSVSEHNGNERSDLVIIALELAPL